MEHALKVQQVRTARAHDVLGWYVNPDDPDNAYASINKASAAAHAALPAGEPAIILLAPGKDHALDGGAFAPPVSRNTIILALAAMCGGVYIGPSTGVIGDIALPDASAEGARREFEMQGVHLTGNFAGQSKWDVRMADLCITGNVTRTHGTQGCYMKWSRTEMGGGAFTDLDANVSGVNGEWHFHDSRFLQLDPAEIITLVDGVHLRVFGQNYFLCSPGGAGILFDLSAGTNTISYYGDTVIDVTIDALGFEIYSDGGSANINHHATTTYTVRGNEDVPVDFGAGVSYSDVKSAFLITDPDCENPEPLNAFSGLIWRDARTRESLTFDGTCWHTGGFMRHETLVDVGGAAADHDCGWNVEGADDVVRTSVRILKDLTGAGGAVKAGFGTKVAGDPKKYGLPGALTAGQTDQKVNPTWNNGGGDDLGITGCDNAGVAAGTLAGSGDADVRIMVWTRRPLTLLS